MRCFATCAFGVSSLVRDEMVALGLKVLAVEDARVFFEGDRAEIINANLWLRCADRVFIELESFEAHTFEQLFDGVCAMPWQQLFPGDANITVTGKTALSKLVSVRDMQSLSKRAICNVLCLAHGYERCPETGQQYQVEIGMLRDVATIALNTSGPGLNRRGYRDLAAEAPLRETLASAMVMLSHYQGQEVLMDPCCGSGTIVIEAAMMAARIAPGLLRTFAFDGWQAWQPLAEQLREEAKQKQRETGFAHLYAWDIDEKTVTMAHRHAKRAGVHGLIHFQTRDIREFDPPAESGVIVTNPPYGERMLAEQAAIVAKALGEIKDKHPRLGLFAISSDPQFEQALGRKADRRRKLYNGNIACQLYMFLRGVQKRTGSRQ